MSATTERPATVPLSRWGSEHFDVLLYLTQKCARGLPIVPADLRRDGRAHPVSPPDAPWTVSRATRLRYGAQGQEPHDDLSCIEDACALGLVATDDQAPSGYAMTPAGVELAERYEAHLSRGGRADNFLVLDYGDGLVEWLERPTRPRATRAERMPWHDGELLGLVKAQLGGAGPVPDDPRLRLRRLVARQGELVLALDDDRARWSAGREFLAELLSWAVRPHEPNGPPAARFLSEVLGQTYEAAARRRRAVLSGADRRRPSWYDLAHQLSDLAFAPHTDLREWSVKVGAVATVLTIDGDPEVPITRPAPKLVPWVGCPSFPTDPKLLRHGVCWLVPEDLEASAIRVGKLVMGEFVHSGVAFDAMRFEPAMLARYWGPGQYELELLGQLREPPCLEEPEVMATQSVTVTDGELGLPFPGVFEEIAKRCDDER